MRKWVRLAARLYPASWRRRYSAEFDALLEDAGSNWRDVLDVLAGAIKMQISTWSFRNVMVACGLAGLTIAAGWAFSLPNVYVSRAMLRITPSQIPENLVPATFNQQMSDHIDRIWQGVVSRGSLAELIQRPGLNLYKNERPHKPLDDVIEQMRTQDIRIEILGIKSGTWPGAKPSSAFSIAVHYPDPFVAQQITSALIAKLMDANQVAARKAARNSAGQHASTLDLLDPASLPQKPTAPNRWQIILIGLVLGLLAGILALGAHRWPLVAVCGLSGLVLAWAASFLVPNVYISRSVIRTDAPRQLPILTQRVLSDDFLKGLIWNFHLYPRSMQSQPIEEVVRKMRDRDLRIETINPQSTAFVISYSYSDRFKAQQVLGAVLGTLFRANQDAEAGTLDLLDPASLPESPVAPNHGQIGGIGMGVGLLGAMIATWVRRRRSPALQPA